MGQELDGLSTSAYGVRIERAEYSLVQRAALIQEHVLVGHFQRQGMPEAVLRLREQACFIQELAGLKLSEPTTEQLRGLLRDSLQERKRNIVPDDRSALQEPLRLGGQPIDT